MTGLTKARTNVKQRLVVFACKDNIVHKSNQGEY